jgi:hypothetical protein
MAATTVPAPNPCAHAEAQPGCVIGGNQGLRGFASPGILLSEYSHPFMGLSADSRTFVSEPDTRWLDLVSDHVRCGQTAGCRQGTTRSHAESLAVT